MGAYILRYIFNKKGTTARPAVVPLVIYGIDNFSFCFVNYRQ